MAIQAMPSYSEQTRKEAISGLNSLNDRIRTLEAQAKYFELSEQVGQVTLSFRRKDWRKRNGTLHHRYEVRQDSDLLLRTRDFNEAFLDYFGRLSYLKSNH
jgi:hypothetical protein